MVAYLPRYYELEFYLVAALLSCFQSGISTSEFITDSMRKRKSYSLLRMMRILDHS